MQKLIRVKSKRTDVEYEKWEGTGAMDYLFGTMQIVNRHGALVDSQWRLFPGDYEVILEIPSEIRGLYLLKKIVTDLEEKSRNKIVISLRNNLLIAELCRISTSHNRSRDLSLLISQVIYLILAETVYTDEDWKALDCELKGGLITNTINHIFCHHNSHSEAFEALNSENYSLKTKMEKAFEITDVNPNELCLFLA